MEGRRSLPYQSAYSSAKHGIEGFLEAMRVELIHEKWSISVNPGEGFRHYRSVSRKGHPSSMSATVLKNFMPCAIA